MNKPTDILLIFGISFCFRDKIHKLPTPSNARRTETIPGTTARIRKFPSLYCPPAFPWFRAAWGRYVEFVGSVRTTLGPAARPDWRNWPRPQVRRWPPALAGDLASQRGGRRAAAAPDPLPFPWVRRRRAWPTSCARERMRRVWKTVL